ESPDIHERMTAILQPGGAIQALGRTFVDRNEGSQRSNNCQIDKSILGAQVANSLTYTEMIETFPDKPHAVVYKAIPVFDLLLVLRPLRPCDSEERRCGGVNGLGNCYDGCLFGRHLPENNFLAVRLDLFLDARIGQPCGKYSSPQTNQSCCEAFMGGHGAANPFWPLRRAKRLEAFCAGPCIGQYRVPGMGKCEGQHRKAKQTSEQGRPGEIMLIFASPLAHRAAFERQA